MKPTRREFLAGAGGLVIAFHLGGRRARAADAAAAAGTSFVPNAWLGIAPDGQVTVQIHKAEMGQGVYTSLAMLVAEELDADWSKVRVEAAPHAKVYVMKGGYGRQFTGGSTSVRGSWDPMREAGAAARDMLVRAAAARWGIEPKLCRTQDGVVSAPENRSAKYGELTAEAAKLEPRKVAPKSAAEYRLLGTSPARLDVPSKVDGSAVFGIDFRLPEMRTAVVERCPVFGGKLVKFDAARALEVPGVQAVFPIESGVAVVANSYIAARAGRRALSVTWNEGPAASLTSAKIFEDFEKAGAKKGSVVRKEGRAKQVLRKASAKIEAVYQLPFLAHATMEPMNCVADVRPDRCDVWAPTQNQSGAFQAGEKFSGVSKENIHVHTLLMGGGFGRRGEWDFCEEAVQVSKKIGKPAKVVWTREDDMQHDFYRPASWHRLQGALDGGGSPLAWSHRIVCPSIVARFLPLLAKILNDPTSTEGAKQLPYGIPNLRVEYVRKDTPVPVGFWRSVGSSHNGFVTECFFDELAAAGKKDPVALRLGLLGGAPRHKAVLELAAEKAGWGTPLPAGRHRGVAVCESFGSFVAQVVEVSVKPDGTFRVHRVVCAVDCGRVVHPSIIEAQMQSGVVYGLSSLKDRITLDKGRVQQGNFDEYPALRMHEMPVVETHILPSTAKLGGIGEVAVPPLAPAVCNALFAATGIRVRTLPIEPEMLIPV